MTGRAAAEHGRWPPPSEGWVPRPGVSGRALTGPLVVHNGTFQFRETIVHPHSTTGAAPVTTTLTPDAAAPAPAPVHAHRRSRGRLVGAAAVAVAGVSLISTGAFSAWDATASVSSGGIGAAVVTPALVDANGGAFTSAVANLLPADYYYRYVDVQNNGSAASTFTGTVAASGDLAGYMAVEVATCSVAWTAPSGVSTCGGTLTTLTTGTPTTGAPMTVNHGSITNGVGNAQHVRYKVTFSATAPITLQGKTGAISASVSNTVVGGRDRTGA